LNDVLSLKQSYLNIVTINYLLLSRGCIRHCTCIRHTKKFPLLEANHFVSMVTATPTQVALELKYAAFCNHFSKIFISPQWNRQFETEKRDKKSRALHCDAHVMAILLRTV